MSVLLLTSEEAFQISQTCLNQKSDGWYMPTELVVQIGKTKVLVEVKVVPKEEPLKSEQLPSDDSGKG
jgi:hypothetical protein